MCYELNQIKKNLTNRTARILDSEQSMQSAVMLPLVQLDGKTHVLFEVRSQKLKAQPGEICFPGGKIDRSDINEETAARRELCEELGLSQQDVKTIAALDYLVTPFRGIIYPFVGEILNPTKMNPNKEEVDDIFTVPLSYLLNTEPECYQMNYQIVPEKKFPFHLIKNQKRYQERIGKMPQYFYFYETYVIWGITAKILHHFLQLVKNNKK